MAKNTILDISNLSKAFSSRMAVDNLSLSAEEGDILGLLGPNGAGKTTTIRMILKLIKKTSGTVKINGYNIDEQPVNALNSIGAMIESPSFHEYLTGYENLKLIANLYKNIDNSRIYEVLDLVNLSDRAKDKVKTYSAGMKQRLGIARALIHKPKLAILDEPTNGLDPQGMRDMYNLIRELSGKEKITFLISSHLLHDVQQICNKVVIINRGKVIRKGDTEQLLNTNQNRIEIFSSEISRIVELISHSNFAKVIEKKDSSVIISVENSTAAEVNAFLVSNNIPVENMARLKLSLEELFLDITEGGH